MVQGAIMAVPAHDERDYEFAKVFGLDIIPVIEGGNVNRVRVKVTDPTSILNS